LRLRRGAGIAVEDRARRGDTLASFLADHGRDDLVGNELAAIHHRLA
jgi:hypothetical protein